jgi:hypothetical protein
VHHPGDACDRAGVFGAPVGQQGEFTVTGGVGSIVVSITTIASCAAGVSTNTAGSPSQPAIPEASLATVFS